MTVMSGKVKLVGFVTLFFLLVASCMLLDVPLFHDSRLMSKWFGCYAAILVLSASLFWWSGTRATSVRIADLAVVVLAIYIFTSDFCRGDLSETVLLRGLSLLQIYLIFRQSIGGKLLDACMAVFFTLAVVLAMWGMVQFVLAVAHEVAERRILPVGLLVALLPFTLFSYPLHYPLAWVLLIMATAMQARHTKVLFSLSAKRAVPLLALSLVCAASPLLYRTIHAEWEWYDVATRSLSGQTRYMIPRYEALYGRLKHSPHFLYNYAAELNYIGEHTHSQQILDECMQRMDDYDTRLLAASNHEHIGNYDLAEKHYRKASAMCPVRFVPLHRLAKLYGKTGRYGDQRIMAQRIMDKEVKVPSQYITEIKDEMRYILEETDY